MTDPFVAEIRLVGFNFAPQGWAFCNGQILPIAQNTALFSLIGTFYGGNGTSNFALPNLQGSMPLGQGQGRGLSQYYLGESGGSAAVTLITGEMPNHNHSAHAVKALGNSTSPAGAVWAQPRVGRAASKTYAQSPAAGTLVPLAGEALGAFGGDQPHNNLPPYLTMNYIIALQGIFPARW
ncbi:phage tail protein [Glaciibacter psychrotolerans]|uniref:Microcystin-dependent protein n=1 Tax=Glaciibacter psychrotolerans TaxID=670054 RepID=A0A7Z0J771_9MICO|nr:tail fiber protein [Leifsonia psychrotolerans]NYJ21185.1 microcystin-dependent protein [Leifsonia psychrotolerans]